MIDKDDKKSGKAKFPTASASYRAPESRKEEKAEEPAQRRVRLLGRIARRGQA